MTSQALRLVAGLGLGLVSMVGAPPASADAAEDRFADADLENALDINEVCAGCHGEHGQGGKDGEYPRLAGLPAAFIARQLELFRERERENLAMVEHTDKRQMPDADIRDISAFLAAIELPSRLPPVDETAADFNAYERLMATKRIVQIPRAEGDPVSGERLYDKECASCHGRDGQGRDRDAVPMLAGQYTAYLERQVEKYIDKRRVHDPFDPDAEELLAAFTAEELRDIFAYVSILDD
ncbi:c-type cytochrome [Thiocapsa marina]|uniref:Cytochrome c, class I n=1 Tax=Thiocapsa marina 5811 TaxID=768671 RepID=F9UFJ2_9GAMM|nr:c-type cytochrome [Thiocapsa marina]EGV16866.1 cytochrome c, class I [Thiocapsa marina 5811]